MDEILTIGQVIDKLEDGDKALCIIGKYKNEEIYKDDFIIRWSDDSEPIHFSRQVLDCRWIIKPKFVSFKKALSVLINGGKIQSYLDFNIYDTYESINDLYKLDKQEIDEMNWVIVE